MGKSEFFLFESLNSGKRPFSPSLCIWRLSEGEAKDAIQTGFGQNFPTLKILFFSFKNEVTQEVRNNKKQKQTTDFEADRFPDWK